MELVFGEKRKTQHAVLLRENWKTFQLLENHLSDELRSADGKSSDASNNDELEQRLWAAETLKCIY